MRFHDSHIGLTRVTHAESLYHDESMSHALPMVEAHSMDISHSITHAKSAAFAKWVNRVCKTNRAQSTTFVRV